jgi:hypothetical protein
MGERVQAGANAARFILDFPLPPLLNPERDEGLRGEGKGDDENTWL